MHESHQHAREGKKPETEDYILKDDIYLNSKKQIKLTFEIKTHNNIYPWAN